jgi:hypothetical protein
MAPSAGPVRLIRPSRPAPYSISKSSEWKLL